MDESCVGAQSTDAGCVEVTSEPIRTCAVAIGQVSSNYSELSDVWLVLLEQS